MPSISIGPEAVSDTEEELLAPQQDPLDSLLRDAALRLLRTDQLSTYERRVAIRELTDLIQRACVELGEAVPTLSSPQVGHTARDFANLVSELDRINERRAALTVELHQGATEVVHAWDALGYSPRDALELLIWRHVTQQPGADPLRPSAVLASALRVLVATWKDAKNNTLATCQMPSAATAVRAALAATCAPERVTERIMAYDFSPARIALVEAAKKSSGNSAATLGTFLTHVDSSSGPRGVSPSSEALACASRCLSVLRRIEGAAPIRVELLRQSLDPILLGPAVTADSPDVFDYIDRARAFADRLRLWEYAAGFPLYAAADHLRALQLPCDAPAPLAALLLKAADDLDACLSF